MAENPNWKIGDKINLDQAAILWIDVCNFSPLCNRLMKDPVKGVEAITQILHEHYDFLLKTITAEGGQPLFFVGDGLMSSWPCRKADAVQAVERAVLCARKVLDENNTLDDTEKPLSLHTVVSYGSWNLAELNGIRSKKLLSFYGDVFSSLSAVTENKAPDQVLISASAAEKLSDSLKSKSLLHGARVLLEFPKPLSPSLESELELNEKVLKKIKEFAPITLSFPLTKERLEWSAEIRPVTTLFMSFPHIDQNEAEKLKQMHDLADAIAPLVSKFEGLLNQIWMDEKKTQLLICFGPSPSAHVDNPARALRLALELKTILKKRGLRIGIGVCTGKAYCGILGNEILRQHTVIGDVVNLSARLSQASDEDVMCDHTTYQAALKTVEFEEAIFRDIKGQPKPIETFIATNYKTEVESENKKRKSIGRSKESAQLEKCIHETINGKASTVIIEGASGIGKTKLLSDLESIAASKECAILRTSGDFLSRNTPYSVWISVFSSLLGVNSFDAVSDQTEILESIHSRFGKRACLLNVVLQTTFPDSEGVKEMSAGKRVEATHDLLMEILQDSTDKRATAIVIDDAQWMDTTCWELIKSVNEELDHVLVVMSILRTGKVDTEMSSDLKNVVRIELKELETEDLQSLVCERLEVKSISQELMALVNRISKGNPFFALEFIGSLQEEKVLNFHDGKCELSKDAMIDDLVLPDSIHGAIRRRLDMLDQGSQLSLKVGSVVGQKFGKSMVSNIYPIELERSAVPLYLEEAEHSGFLNIAMVDNGDGYFFNNATTAEVAYEMTLAEQRRHLHLKSAQWYESHFADKLHPFYVRLAHHWEHADNSIKASEYIVMESGRLLAAGFVDQAIKLGLRGIELFDIQIENDPEKVGAMIGQTMGEIAALMGDRTISSLADLKEIDNEKIERLVFVLVNIGPTAHVGGRLDLFVLMSVLALKNTLEHGNSKATADVYSMYAIVFRSLTGNSHGAFEWSKLALKMDQQYGGTVHSRVAHIHNWFLGHWVLPIKDTYETNRLGAESGAKSGDVIFECYNLASHVVFLALAGEHLDKVIETGRKQFKILNRRVMHASFHIILEIQLAKALRGLTASSTEFTDEEFDEQKELAFMLDTPIDSQKGFYMVARIKILTHFGQWDKAVEWMDKVLPIVPAIANQVAEMEYDYYGSIALLYHASSKKGDEKAELLTRADASMLKIHNAAENYALNFEHKALTLNAIKEGLFGDSKKAIEMFEKALSLGKVSTYANDYAMTLEHLLRHEHAAGMPKTSLKNAIVAWDEIGATAKSQYLTKTFN